jgi:mRNA-degrading endonuclease YafQ of YafQ-DinJ toxin-antitoxin module
MFTFDFSEELEEAMAKLAKKDKVFSLALNKKIREIVSCDEKTIEHYADSKHQWAGLKHVHIASSSVLFFRVFKKEQNINFVAIRRHDEAFGR